MSSTSRLRKYLSVNSATRGGFSDLHEVDGKFSSGMKVKTGQIHRKSGLVSFESKSQTSLP